MRHKIQKNSGYVYVSNNELNVFQLTRNNVIDWKVLRIKVSINWDTKLVITTLSQTIF